MLSSNPRFAYPGSHISYVAIMTNYAGSLHSSKQKAGKAANRPKRDNVGASEEKGLLQR